MIPTTGVLDFTKSRGGPNMTEVRIPARLAKRLEALAKARGKKPETLAREAIARAVEEEETRLVEQTEAAFAEPGNHSTEEVLTHLAGIIRKHEHKRRKAA